MQRDSGEQVHHAMELKDLLALHPVPACVLQATIKIMSC